LRRAVLALVGLAAALPFAASAADLPQDKAELEQIRLERVAVEQRYQQAESSCRQRFAVSGCIEEAQAQRRKALADLRQRELALDEARRRSEAEQARLRQQAKQAEAQRRPPPEPLAAKSASAPAEVAASAPAAKTPVRGRSKTADDAAAAAARAAAQQQRASEAAAHREEVERRNAERAARGKTSKPLPVPSAASVAATSAAVASAPR